MFVLRTTLAMCFACLLISPAGAMALSSPNGAIRFHASIDAQGHLVYSVTENGRLRLEPAEAGVVVDGADLGAGAHLGTPKTRNVSEVFAWRGNKTQATNRCEASEIPVRSQTGIEWTLEVRVFNDGVAFRYRIALWGHRCQDKKNWRSEK